MPTQIPKRNDWKALKTKYKIGDAAVMGINLGQSLDNFHAKFKEGLLHARGNAAAAKELDRTTTAYLQKIMKNKRSIKDWPAFERDFGKDYVEAPRALAEEQETFAAECEAFAKHVTLVRSAVGKLPKAGATIAQLTALRDGALKDILEAAAHVKHAFDAAALCKLLSSAVKGINLMEQREDKTTPEVINGFVETLKTATEQLVKRAKELGLF
jgi:hypothetical protein